MNKNFLSRNCLIAILSLVAVQCAAQLPSYLPTNGLVAWYPFNGNANDESGNGNNGVVNGAVLATNRFGVAYNAYSFNGSNTSIKAIANNLPTGSSSSTMSIWFSAAALPCGSSKAMLTYGTWSCNQARYIGFRGGCSGNLLTYAQFCNDINSSYTYQLNNWYHFVATSSGGTIKLYLNAQLVGTYTLSAANTANGNIAIGCVPGSSNGDFFNGLLDDAAIWNRVLTENEISNLYNAIPCTLNTASQPSSNPSVCSNSPMDPILIQTTGATGIGTPSGLPIGVSANWANNVVTLTGTPISSGNYNYTIPLTGGCGYVTASGSIIVNAANTASAPSSSPSICLNSSIVPIAIPTTGATGIGTPTNLPAGISASWSNNTISITGNASSYGSYQYSIPLQGGCGLVSALGSIIVFPPSNNSASSSTSIPYQAELRDTNGEIVPNASIDLRFTLHELTSDGAVSYKESHALSTNGLGLFSASIGSGLAIEGCYNSINWKQVNKFLQVEVNMGNGWITMGNQQLMSVPFSIIAQKAMQFETQNLPVFENNTQATNGGLQPGALYRTSIGDLKVVY